MAPHYGLVHPQQYDWRDSNVSLINSTVDHKVKHQSAATEPAWNNNVIGVEPGLYIWRIENFEVVPWPKERYGSFHEGDSYIVLLSEKTERKNGENGEDTVDASGEKDKWTHNIFFWLGSHTTQDEAGTAAYKTVELDEFLYGRATQHRELQTSPSPAFSQIFPHLRILRGGAASGFTHVDALDRPEHIDTLLRIFKNASPGAGRDAILVHEVEPTWRSLDENDVFVLDRGDKIFVWQGAKSAPMEKLKAAQVVSDMTVAKHVDVEVLSQAESRSRVVVDFLGGGDVEVAETKFECARPVVRSNTAASKGSGGDKRLFKLSDAEGRLSLTHVKSGEGIHEDDFKDDDIFLFDSGWGIWVWEGRAASMNEKRTWLKAAERYLGDSEDGKEKPIAKVVQGREGRGFWTAVGA